MANGRMVDFPGKEQGKVQQKGKQRKDRMCAMAIGGLRWYGSGTGTAGSMPDYSGQSARRGQKGHHFQGRKDETGSEAGRACSGFRASPAEVTYTAGRSGRGHLFSQMPQPMHRLSTT